MQISFSNLYTAFINKPNVYNANALATFLNQNPNDIEQLSRARLNELEKVLASASSAGVSQSGLYSSKIKMASALINVLQSDDMPNGTCNNGGFL